MVPSKHTVNRFIRIWWPPRLSTILILLVPAILLTTVCGIHRLTFGGTVAYDVCRITMVLGCVLHLLEDCRAFPRWLVRMGEVA
jgi:hypothetical protein